MLEILVLIFIVVFAVFIIVITENYNSFTESKNKVIRSKATIDVYLKQRFDLIPNIVETVKAYSNYEESTLKELVDLRTRYQSDNEKNISNESEMNNNLTRLIGVVEAYPNLKASENYLDLQHQLEKVESELQAARRLYNMDVTEYNNKIQMFPGNFFASFLNFKPAEWFSVDAEESKAVKIDL